jgi:hypothetical protein
MNWRAFCLSSLVVVLVSGALAQESQAQISARPPVHTQALERHYVAGTVLHYRMVGDNDGRHYSLLATNTVKRDAAGHFFEEIVWSDLTSDPPQPMSAASLALRQTVSLDDPKTYMKVPNLAGVQPALIGPITDLLTFSSDLVLAAREHLSQLGQTAYVPRTTPNSWADGHYVLVGQDAVDFSLKVASLDPAHHTMTLVVEHVPPPALHIQRPAPWMQEQQTTPPANFVQVSRQGDGYITELGHESFTVRLILDTNDGRILSATMHNPVEMTVRTCPDAGLAQCSSPSPRTIVRDISLQLEP